MHRQCHEFGRSLASLLEDEMVNPIRGVVDADGRIELPDGRHLDLVTRRPPISSKAIEDILLLDVIEPCHFDVCPICLEEPADTAEHVPPRSLGGGVVTSTCRRCNNDFGIFEAELDLRARDAFRAPTFSRDGVPGRRRVGEVSTVIQADGSPVWIVKRPGEGVLDMFKAGGGAMEFQPPRERLWATALLKHAYLAACVYLRDIPNTPHAAFARQELLAARSAGKRHQLGELSAILKAYRLYDPPPAPLFLAGVPVEDGHQLALGLGTFGAVVWPLPDARPLCLLQLRARRNRETQHRGG
jgi:hypothetical protein